MAVIKEVAVAEKRAVSVIEAVAVGKMFDSEKAVAKGKVVAAGTVAVSNRSLTTVLIRCFDQPAARVEITVGTVQNLM